MVVTAHLGRPKGEPERALLAAPVAARLGELLGARSRSPPTRSAAERRRDGGGLAGRARRRARERPLQPRRDQQGRRRARRRSPTSSPSWRTRSCPTASGSCTASRRRVYDVAQRLPHAMGALVAKEIEVLRRLTVEPGAPLRRRARRLEGLRQARCHRQPAREGRQAADRWRDGVHLPQGAGPRGGQEPAGGRPARRLSYLPRPGQGVGRRDPAADRHRGRHRVPVGRPRAPARRRTRPRRSLPTPSAWTSVPSLQRRSLRPSRTRRPSSGTARWASSRSMRSRVALAPWPRR